MHTNKHELWSTVARQSSKKRSSQRQIQHAGLVNQYGIALQRIVSGMLKCANYLIRLYATVAS